MKDNRMSPPFVYCNMVGCVLCQDNGNRVRLLSSSGTINSSKGSIVVLTTVWTQAINGQVSCLWRAEFRSRQIIYHRFIFINNIIIVCMI